MVEELIEHVRAMLILIEDSPDERLIVVEELASQLEEELNTID